MKRWLSRQ
ncbi:hypothetical protein O3G_MSEX013612, partial [Manduca sexta]